MHRLFFVALMVAGCGGGADPAQNFVGTWTFASGTDNVSCPNGTTSTKLTGSVTVKRGTDGADLVVLDAEGCNFSYALDGAGATATTNAKMCSFPVPELGQGVNAAVTYDAITLTTSDGKSMSDQFSGRVTYSASTGNLDCIFSGTAMLTKVSAD